MSWRVIACAALAALVFGYLYLFVIRLIGGIIIYVTLVLAILVFAAGGVYTFFKRDMYDPLEPSYKYMTYAAYTFFAIDVIIILLVCCCMGAIKLGIAVFKTTA